MLKSVLPLLAALALATPALAADDADWRFGGDAYMAGRSVTFSGAAVEDLFAAGDKVTVRSDVDGSAHLAGRNVTLDGRVGGDFYGVGMNVDLAAPVAGNATAMGEDVRVGEPVSGNLRSIGQDVELAAPVAGSAILGGDRVSIGAEIGGDLAVSANEVVWRDGARVAGEVHVYADDPKAIEVPESVAPADRVQFHATEEWSDDVGAPVPVQRPGFFTRLRGWLGGVVVVGLLGTLLSAIAPGAVTRLRETALARPLRTGWIGFLGFSVLVGSAVPLILTGIGAVLVPLSILAAVLLGIGGYVVGTYVIGVWSTGLMGRPAPRVLGERAIAAFAGAALVALVGLVPWLGWLAVLAVFLLGAGAMVVRVFAPSFRQDAPAA